MDIQGHSAIRGGTVVDCKATAVPRCLSCEPLVTARFLPVVAVVLQVGWPRRPQAKMTAALSNSYMVSSLSVRSACGKRDVLIGAPAAAAATFASPYPTCIYVVLSMLLQAYFLNLLLSRLFGEVALYPVSEVKG